MINEQRPLVGVFEGTRIAIKSKHHRLTMQRTIIHTTTLVRDRLSKRRPQNKKPTFLFLFYLY